GHGREMALEPGDSVRRMPLRMQRNREVEDGRDRWHVTRGRGVIRFVIAVESAGPGDGAQIVAQQRASERFDEFLTLARETASLPTACRRGRRGGLHPPSEPANPRAGRGGDLLIRACLRVQTAEQFGSVMAD